MSNASSKPTSSNKSEQVSSTVPRVPWNPWWGVAFVFIVFFGAQFVVGALLTIYPALRHWTQDQAVDWLNHSINLQFVYLIATEALIIAAIYWFLRRYKETFTIIGLRRPQWNDFVMGVAAVLPYMVIYLLTVTIVGHFVPSLNIDQQQELGFNDVHGGLQLALTFICLVILPPITEEILVRGFLYSSLKKALPTIYAVIGTSLLFAAAHLPEGGTAGPLYIAALDTFVLSLVLIYLREKTGGLWASMTLHAIKNCIAFLAVFVLGAH